VQLPSPGAPVFPGAAPPPLEGINLCPRITSLLFHKKEVNKKKTQAKITTT
jgi:hypothetical protein